jgi:hypothetical protein
MAGIGRDAATKPAGALSNGFMGYDRRTSLKMIKDGTSHTIALTESSKNNGPWAQGGTSNVRGFDPDDKPFVGDGSQFGGHSRFCNAVMADGSLRRIEYSLDAKKLAAAITIAGNDPVDFD